MNSLRNILGTLHSVTTWMPNCNLARKMSLTMSSSTTRRVHTGLLTTSYGVVIDGSTHFKGTRSTARQRAYTCVHGRMVPDASCVATPLPSTLVVVFWMIPRIPLPLLVSREKLRLGKNGIVFILGQRTLMSFQVTPIAGLFQLHYSTAELICMGYSNYSQHTCRERSSVTASDQSV